MTYVHADTSLSASAAARKDNRTRLPPLTWSHGDLRQTYGVWITEDVDGPLSRPLSLNYGSETNPVSWWKFNTSAWTLGRRGRPRLNAGNLGPANPPPVHPDLSTLLPSAVTKWPIRVVPPPTPSSGSIQDDHDPDAGIPIVLGKGDHLLRYVLSSSNDLFCHCTWQKRSFQ